VDAESENLIQKAIDTLLHERTTFVIAHRFSTIQSADEIVVMDRGRIIGQGRHEELLRTCEVYQQLYERQLIAAPVGCPAIRLMLGFRRACQAGVAAKKPSCSRISVVST